MDDDWEEIKVNRRKSDKVYFESPFIQSISDSIDLLRDEGKAILDEIDATDIKREFDSIEIDELSDSTVNQISDIVDDVSKYKNEILDYVEVPDVVMDSVKGLKVSLNRDEDYVRMAKRRLNRINTDDSVDYTRMNVRIVELSRKAIEVNHTNWEAYYLKGIALINLEQYCDAIESLFKSLALNEDNVNARLYIGNAYRLNGEFDSAIGAYDSALDFEDGNYDAYKGKAFTYYNWEKYDEACEFFEKANSIETLDDKSKEIWDICLEKL